MLRKEGRGGLKKKKRELAGDPQKNA